ncbi:MAG TPA: APC family permease, partial [Gemmataceae bacterium]|nr:APC family permease [Gemmataceae bacterium]
MSTSEGSAGSSTRPLVRAAQVIIVSSVMFTFISYWRTAAVVLCDLASTAYYIGGAVEAAIGPAAPWFILAVMLFSYAVRSVYIESCSLFVRGGVYRVVKEAMGGFLAKLSVSALMFDYILTGPTSAVSAGQYIMGLLFQTLKLTAPTLFTDLGLEDDKLRTFYVNWGAVVIACLVTLYFFRLNLIGIHESSDKALKIMGATTVMAVIMLAWCGITLAINGAQNSIPLAPDFNPKVEPLVDQKIDPETGKVIEESWVRNPKTGKLVAKIDPKTGQPEPRMSEALSKVGITAQEDPLGMLPRILPADTIEGIRNPVSWFSILGLVGLLIAFGHSILAMSGEETLAQVYREVESPKLPNFKKAAFIVFVYSLVLTVGISFMAVALIPDEVRMKDYSGNLIGGLARYVIGPAGLKLFLEMFVVVVGFLILSGAVNTAIIGSNGVLNRVAEDGVLPDALLKPHPRYGTTHRILYLITGLQLLVIIFSGGDMILLTEAYAFGVVWSFVFKALAMVVLRFKDRSPREFKVPLNFKIGTVEVPFGLGLIFLILLFTAILNLFTKEVATVGGLGFTVFFLTIFMVSEHLHDRRRHGKGIKHEHLDQFNQQRAESVTPATLHLEKPFRKLVAIRSPQNLFMLEKALAETDPECTDVVVMTAKFTPPGESGGVNNNTLDRYDQQLMTAVVERGEKAGKPIHPLIVPTNNPVHAILNTAKALHAQEVIVGASNKFTAEEQLDQIAFYWINLHEGMTPPLTVRVLSRSRDVYLDLEGGNRIPKISELKARSVAELRAAGVGVERVLMVHDGTPSSSDVFQAVMTMLDPQVTLDLAAPAAHKKAAEASLAANVEDSMHLPPLAHDQERARKLGREMDVHALTTDWGLEI